MIDESRWEPSRLIPVSGIKGEAEQERRGCSALLAVVGSVREFGRALLAPLGAPAGEVSTFVEVLFDLDDRRVRPDGVIRVVRAKRVWTALVEVKAAEGKLQAAQVEDYLDVARQQAYDLVLTISNEIEVIPGEHPTIGIDKKKLKKGVALAHLSWSQIHTEALIERANDQITDADQKWILSELIRYLEHENSGAVDFQDMGEAWVRVRDGAAKGTLRPLDKGLNEIAARYDQLIAFAGMRLSRRLGVEVRPALTRAELRDLNARTQAAAATLAKEGTLRGLLRVPHAAADISIVADLRAGHVRCSADVDAPRQGRQQTRVRWLTRQLNSAPNELHIEATFAYQRAPGPSVPVSDLRDKPELVIIDKSKEIKSFTLTLATRAGSKRGAGRGSFTDSVLDLVEQFYTTVVQGLKPWIEPAPTPHPDGPTNGASNNHIAGELPAQITPRSRASVTDEGSAETGSGAVDEDERELEVEGS
jgi:hypothetical protein